MRLQNSSAGQIRYAASPFSRFGGSTNLVESDFQQGRGLFERGCRVAHAHGEMMRWSLCAPCRNKTANALRETIAAVGVADFKNLSSHAFALGNNQLEPCFRVLGHREQGYRA